MCTHILKQIWNKRRANAWIFLELILVTFFMWGVIDPVYVLQSNRAIPYGYNVDQTFRIMLGQYASTHRRYQADFDSDSARMVHLLQIYDQVRNYPGVESAVIVNSNQYPFSNWMNSTTIQHDTLESNALLMSFYQDGDFFNVFRIKDIHTGMIPDHHNPDGQTVYITENLEHKLTGGRFGLMEKDVYEASKKDTLYHKVKGIMSDFKFQSTDQPIRTRFVPEAKPRVSGFAHASQICFRIRDGLSQQRFAEEFKREMTSRLAVGNLYLLNLTDFESIGTQIEIEYGVTNKFRLQTALAIFFLICTFLGIAGTFWLRSDMRRGEIGLRMALGSSRKQILKEFLIESWCITTLAWLVGLFFVFQRVYLTGFAEPSDFPSDVYLQNRFVSHFLIVSLIVYVLLLLITVVGTLIPARQAAAVSPSDALRDE